MPLVKSIYEDTSPYFTYEGDWVPGDSVFLNEYSESSFRATNQLGASLSFTFRGTSASIFGARSGNHGKYQVEVDGVIYPEEDGRAEPPIFRDVLFSIGGETRELDDGEHRVRLVNRENTFLDVDQISWSTPVGEGDESLIVNTYQSLHPSWAYRPDGSWTSDVPEVGRFEGGVGHATARQGAYAELTFTGDMIAVFGGAGPSSTSAYSISVDSSSASSPTSYSALQPHFRSKQLLYWKAGLGAGQHTIRLTKDSSAANESLSIDYATAWTTESLGGAWLGESAPGGKGTSRGGNNPTGENSDSPKSSKGLIVGIAVLTAIIGLLLLGLASYLFRRYRREQQRTSLESTIESKSTILPSMLPRSRPSEAIIHPFIIGASPPSSHPSHSAGEGGGAVSPMPSNESRGFVKGGTRHIPAGVERPRMGAMAESDASTVLNPPLSQAHVLSASKSGGASERESRSEKTKGVKSEAPPAYRSHRA